MLQVQAAVEAADDAEAQKDPGCLRKVSGSVGLSAVPGFLGVFFGDVACVSRC